MLVCFMLINIQLNPALKCCSEQNTTGCCAMLNINIAFILRLVTIIKRSVFAAVPLSKFKIDISNPNPTRTCARVTSGNTDTTNNTLFIPCSPVVQGSIVKIGMLNNEHRALSIGEFLVFGTRRE